MSFIILDPIDREQRRSQITHFFEQAIQSSLVSHRAGEKRIAVLFQRDGQALKPVCPLRTQMAFDPDFVNRDWLASVLGLRLFDMTCTCCGQL